MSKFIHPVSAEACVERWYTAHKDVVERVFKKRLRLFPDQINDGIQSFWLDFLEKERCERFDPALCPSEAGYLGVLALRQAMNLFIALVKRQKVNPPIEESEILQTEERFYGAGNDANEYLLHLVSTNHLKPVEAMVFICKVWTHVGPVELAQRYCDSTLFSLCDFVAAHFKRPDDNVEVPRKLLRVLREQLGLPLSAPLGERTLTELAHARHDAGNAGKQTVQDVLFDYLEQAKRAFAKGEKDVHESISGFIRRIVAAFLTTLRNRFGFLIELTQDVLRPIHAEKLLAWGWEKLLNMELEKYGGLSCALGSKWLVARMTFLLADFPTPNDLAKSLSGYRPEETILRCLELLGTDATHAVRAVEARYRRACSREG